MKIGTRIPIATGSFRGRLGGVGAVGDSIGVQTQFQYIDVGVEIEMTPTVHYDHDVTLKIKIEVSSEDERDHRGVTEPIIAQKKSEQVIRLHEGDATVLTGILTKRTQSAGAGFRG